MWERIKSYLYQAHKEFDKTPLCICSHSLFMHSLTQKHDICLDVIEVSCDVYKHPCPCKIFKLDNLKYLEQQYKEQINA